VCVCVCVCVWNRWVTTPLRSSAWLGKDSARVEVHEHLQSEFAEDES